MTLIHEILEYNREFVEKKRYEAFDTTRFPNKRIAVLSCMDTRLTKLLPAALNFENGDIKIITNAGAMITHPYGSVMRSLLVAIYELGVREIMVIGHYECGMKGLEASHLLQKMAERGITSEKTDSVKSSGIDIEKWLSGFDNPVNSVAETVALIQNHLLVPADVNVYGFLMNPHTGKLDQIDKTL